MNPFEQTCRWLRTHAGFPGHRLPAAAELMLCAAAWAQMEEHGSATGPKLFERRVGAQTASLKAHALRRSQVHYKCDNSAKV